MNETPVDTPTEPVQTNTETASAEPSQTTDAESPTPPVKLNRHSLNLISAHPGVVTAFATIVIAFTGMATYFAMNKQYESMNKQYEIMASQVKNEKEEMERAWHPLIQLSAPTLGRHVPAANNVEGNFGYPHSYIFTNTVLTKSPALDMTRKMMVWVDLQALRNKDGRTRVHVWKSPVAAAGADNGSSRFGLSSNDLNLINNATSIHVRAEITYRSWIKPGANSYTQDVYFSQLPKVNNSVWGINLKEFFPSRLEEEFAK